MNTRKYLNGVAIILAAAAVLSFSARPAMAQGAQTTYTLPEYNAHQAAQAEKDPAARIKLLDDFVAKFPASTLMQYVDQLYYQTYFQLKNYPKAVEYTDKLLALGDKADLPIRVQAIQARVQLFPLAFDAKAADAHDQLTKERDAAMMGVKLLPDLKKAKPDVTDDQIKAVHLALLGAAGAADLQLKDNAGAVEAFKAVLALNPGDAITSYRLGLAYIGMNPPQSLDGFWALARSIDLKIQDSDKIKDYLRKSIINYEQANCDNLIDAQLSELLQLAANAPERPQTYSIPSAADLQKVVQASTIITVISDLSAGGDKAKMTWLATCGAEFPEVVGKIIDVQNHDTYVDFLVFTSASSDEIQAATTANMDVKVWIAPPPAASAPAGAAATAPPPPQPDVVRLMKDDEIRFSGSMAGYDPSPFILHWDGVKVDPSVIPEKAAPGKKPAAPRKAPPKS